MKRTMICKLVKAGQTSKRLVRYLLKKSIAARADLGFGTMRMGKDMAAWAAEVLRANRAAAKRASEARHLILAVEKGTLRRLAIRLLYAAFADWRKVHAPDRAWVAAIHFHQGAYHLHAAIANVGPDGQPLKYKPHQVVGMSEIKFTDLAISAHGTGKKGLPIYTKARGRLLVQDLADLLVSPAGDIEDDVWQCLEEAGAVSNFRTRKDGSPISFECAGRRIRFTTLRRCMLDQHNPQPEENTMPIASLKPDQALPDSIAATLKTAGFSSDDLASLQRNLQAAHDSRPSVPAPIKTVQPQPKPPQKS